MKITLLIVALAFSIKADAQYDVMFSHYFDMETSFNPAAAGKEAKMNITGAYAMDLAGFEHNPQTAYISADMPLVLLNSTHGVGLMLMNDKLGLFNHMRLGAQYANKQRLFGGQISIGVQATLLSEKFDGSKLDLDVENDPALTKSALDGNAIDFSAGLYYTRKSFYVGVSAQHLTSPKIELGETNELKVDATYYVTTGYDFKLRNPLLTVKTSALGRSDGKGYRADFTGRLLYSNDTKQFYGGLSYSPGISVTFLAGILVQGVNFGYSYECYTNGINPGNGSHELFVGYKMDVNLIKKGKNLHKAVRIL